MVKRNLKKSNEQDDSQMATALPAWCQPTDGRTFDELMDREWEELVIRFDENKKDYVFKTACCKGAHVC